MRGMSIILATLLHLVLACGIARAGSVHSAEPKDSTVIEEFSIWYRCDSIDVDID